MIYVMGDIHGALEVYKVTDHFKNKEANQEDVLMLLGDVGVCWDCGKKNC